jgi:hypothetical protein
MATEFELLQLNSFVCWFIYLILLSILNHLMKAKCWLLPTRIGQIKVQYNFVREHSDLPHGS